MNGQRKHSTVQFSKRTLVLMTKIPLDVLKSGLDKLKSQFQGRKNDLLARLSRKEKLSAEDEEWLDHDANLVDEEALVDTLDEASDYERKLAMLDTNKRSLVQKLMGYGAEKADVNGIPGKKRART